MQYLKRLKPQVLPLQNSSANTIYVDSDDETIKVGTGASGSTERTLIDSNGGGGFANGTAAAPSAFFTTVPTTGLFYSTPNTSIGISFSGTERVRIGADQLSILSDTAIIRLGAAVDVVLARDAANTLAQKNGTTAQAFRVYNTITSGTDNELFSVDWKTTANTLIVGSRTGSVAGTGRPTLFGSQASTGTNNYMGMAANGAAATILIGNLDNTAIAFGSRGTSSGSSIAMGGTYSAASTTGTLSIVAITPTYTGGGTSSFTDLLISRTETSVGSGTQRVIDAQVAALSVFSVSNAGSISYSGSLNQSVAGSIINLNAGTNTGATTNGAVTAIATKAKSFTAIANNTATDVLTVTVPNAAHSGTVRVILSGSLGAGGAIGANEATGNISYDFAIARTAGVATVVTPSAAYGSSTSAVAGAATITITAAASAISGAVGATQTFTVQVTIARGSGSSTNHTCMMRAELLNSNATGITVA